MKRGIEIIVVNICMLVLHVTAHAQVYSRGEQSVIQPSQVMIENYTTIILGKEVADDPNGNRFDKMNPYTYLQIVYDDMGKGYHILFQANFSGKILFLAYSNNLTILFNNREKPLNVFVNCTRQINAHISPVQNAEAAVTCIIERLNYCSN